MTAFRTLVFCVAAVSAGLGANARLCGAALNNPSAPTAAPAAQTEQAPLTEREKAAHALNRLGYGPRPGEIERVAALGVENWIRQQLAPSEIPDFAAEKAVAPLSHLQMDPAEIFAAYYTQIRERRNRVAKASAAAAMAEGKAPETMSGKESKLPETTLAKAPAKENKSGEEARRVVAQAVGELHQAKLVRAVLSERQLEQVLVDFWFNHFNVDGRKNAVRAALVTYEQDVIRPHIWGNFRDLLGATAQSAAMLVYLDNVRSSAAAPASAAKFSGKKYARGTDDNMTKVARPATKRGLNENYGRELMELHTLGVDAGYTQKDVQEVARAFTGWTLVPRTGQFIFRRDWHDEGEKTILGQHFAIGGGQEDGERVLDLLSLHPATAHHLAYELCQRFVSDDPPAPLVDRVAKAFLDSRGNLRATYEALFLDPEFFAPQFYAAKTKSPFEFIASALRASASTFVDAPATRNRERLRVIEAAALLGRGGERTNALPRKTATLHLVDMGQPNYGWGPPTGFPEDSSHWVAAGALVSRLNFALALTAGQVPETRPQVRRLVEGVNPDQPAALVDAIARNMFARDLSASTRRVVLAQGAPSREGEMSVPDVPRVLALMLGSPEFQRR
ncbi:MAG TPA: DUF1800 domain-containing protein [Opitutaceae bacterium]|nr:DUF1800 domain-containing protein [Opitutaceae bacterium]